jgi:GT2 family glycosyltransferase
VKLSNIILAYNLSHLTKALLDSMFKYTPNKYLEDIIIVDNGSTDDTSDLWKNYDINTYIRNKVNTGFSHATNQGIKVANGDWIAIWNNDTEVNENCIEVMMANTGDYGIMSGMLVEPGINIESVEEYRKTKSNFEGTRHDFTKGNPWIIKREVFDTIGLFDENFYPIQYEDWDFFLRTSLAKFKFGFFSGATVFHHSSITQKEILKPQYGGTTSYSDYPREYFYKKWGTLSINWQKAYETGEYI